MVVEASGLVLGFRSVLHVCKCAGVIVIADRFKYLSTQPYSHCSVGLRGQSRCAPKLGDNKAHITSLGNEFCCMK